MKKLVFTMLVVPGLLAAFLFLGSRAGALAQSATSAVPAKITISGKVTMGTPGLTLPVTTSLILHAHDEHEMALMLDGQADAQGAFRFEGLENRPGRTFDVMAIVGPTQYYAQTITPQAGQSDYTAPITIYGTTKDTSNLRIDRLHNFVEFINRQQVRTTEIYVLSNAGDRTIEGGEVAADGRAASLRFRLPAGAEQVRFDGGDVGTRFFRTADGFLDAQGVPPGEGSGQVMVSYVLPYNGQVHLEHPVNYAVQGTDVILPVDAGITLAGNGLEAQGTQQAPNGTAMKIFSGQALPAGASLAYDLSGQLSAAQASLLDGGAAQGSVGQAPESVPASLAWALRATVGGSPLSAALMGVGLLLLALALLWWLRTPAPAPVSAGAGAGVRDGRDAGTDRAEPASERDALVQAIADLDDAHAAGLVAAEEYQAQRRRLLDHLLALVENSGPLAAHASPEG